MKSINDLILQWKIVSLIVDVTEEVTKKEEKQEAIFETVETITVKEIDKPKKKGRPKKGTKKSSRA
jgi:hypothetical protein